jgi:hypothetical protein
VSYDPFKIDGQGAVGHIEHAQRVGDTHTFRVPTVVDAAPLRCEGGDLCAGAQMEGAK